MRTSLGSVLAGAAVTAVIAAVVAGLLIVGAPIEERTRRMDERRVADLRGIKAAIDLYWTRHARVPATLGDLSAEPGVRITGTDPASSEPYGYRPLDETRYEVCASFERESGELSGDPTGDVWAHGPGRQCFRLEAKDISSEAR